MWLLQSPDNNWSFIEKISVLYTFSYSSLRDRRELLLDMKT